MLASVLTPLLELRAVSKRFGQVGALGRLLGGEDAPPALDEVSVAVPPRSVLGIVGESGSGKSTLAQAAVGLIEADAGTVLWGGQDRARMGREDRGRWQRRIQMVFQDTSAALNPRKSVGRCLTETIALAGTPRDARPAEAARLLGLVGLGPEALGRLPHQLSGGQRQRVGIARALAMAPDVLIADEPVASLDVSLQAQVVNLLLLLTRDLGLTLVFISHDLALVRRIATGIVVMHRGRIVEQGPAEAIFAAPRHPYTRLLLDAVPRGLAGRGQARAAIAPDDGALDQGCHFRARCPRAGPPCIARPALAGDAGHLAACFFPIRDANHPAPASSLSPACSASYGSADG